MNNHHPTPFWIPALLALGLATPAAAQWKGNPVLERANLLSVPYVEGCRLALADCPLRVVGGSPEMIINRLDRNGYQLVERYVVDPVYGFVSNQKQIYTSTELVGCAIADRDAMFAYTVFDTGLGAPPLSLIRVTRVHWNSSTDQYDTVAPFPVTISTQPASDLAITPNITSGGTIDGVHVAWYERNGSAVPVSVREERVNGVGGTYWGANGVVIDTSLGSTALKQGPSIVSTRDGLAVTTYQSSASGALKHRTAKADTGSAFPIPVTTLPGQSGPSTSKCCVAYDGAGGAWYGFATEPTNTTLVTAHVPLLGNGAPLSLAFWNSASGGGLGGQPLNMLRALSMLAMPSGDALLVYRDLTGIRCIDFALSGTTITMPWTRFVRGASQPNDLGDAADTVLLGTTAAIVTTSNEQVHIKAIETNGTETWGVGSGVQINAPTPPKWVTADAPQWPHVWPTMIDPYTPGFLVGWGDIDTGAEDGCHIAERLSTDGEMGKTFLTGQLGSGFSLNSALVCNLQLPDWVSLTGFVCELSGSATGGVDVYGRIGGSFVGFETNAAAWTLLGSGTLTQPGPGLRGHVTFASPIALPPGTNALCVKANGFALGGTAASGAGLTLASADMTMQCGAQIANWPAGPVTQGRVMQGGFDYVPGNPSPAAAHIPFGSGCYAQTDSFYQHFATAADAATVLNGNSLTMLFMGSQYSVQWGGGTYIPPTGPALTGFAPNADDGVATVTLPQPMPVPGGIATVLYVHSNGNVWLGDNSSALTPNDYVPRANDMLAAPHTGFWSWHDFDPSEPGSGPIVVDIAGFNTVTITWLDVESYPRNAVNRSTMQFQFDLMTGNVTLCWPSLSPNSASPFGSGYLVGYSPGGASVNGGSIALATAPPFMTNVGMFPLTLGASPAPLLGTTTTFTTSDLPPAGPGIYFGAQIYSLGATPGGIDLGFLGAPGCRLYVPTLDVMHALLGTTPTLTDTLTIPNNPSLSGFEFYTQSIALVPPNSLPNGQNAFGVTTSNGLKTRVGNH